MALWKLENSLDILVTALCLDYSRRQKAIEERMVTKRCDTEFRYYNFIIRDAAAEIVGYDDMHPMYTVFNKENKNFSGIWAYFSEDYETFLKDYEDDVRRYSTSTRYTPKEGTPANSFNISMVPWVEFTGFNINVFDEGKFLLPIITMGKFFERDGKRLLPLAIQVHHAVCDGYHVGVFVEKLQSYVDQF